MQKKVLILGGRPIGSCELVEFAHKCGYYAIVADYLPASQSPAKNIADENWDCSTAEVDKLAEMCRSSGVSAVLTGVHEFNIERKIELAEKLGLPSYCSMQQWRECENKASFKAWCIKFGIDVAKTYDIHDDHIDYPVIAKPLDGSGSRGFSICRNYEELVAGVSHAKQSSPSGKVLIEEFVEAEAAIVHYTAVNGEIYFCGMSDKHSQSCNGGARIMAIQTFPSDAIDRYLREMDGKAKNMLKAIGIKNGPFWIEIFVDEQNGRFVFNEAGYRFGGSLTNYPVMFYYGVDQLQLMFDNALGVDARYFTMKNWRPPKSRYCILPIHLRPGVITSIDGVSSVRGSHDVPGWAQVHYEGDKIEDWGTAQQVFAYLHLDYENNDELRWLVDWALSTLRVLDQNGKNMLYCLFDTNRIKELK